MLKSKTLKLIVTFIFALMLTPFVAQAGDQWEMIGHGAPCSITNAMTVDQNNADVLYKVSAGGVVKSINGGGKWFNINEGIPFNGVRYTQ